MVHTITRKQDLRTMGQLADATGIKYATIYHRVVKLSEIPHPSVRWGKRWYYSAEDFERLVACLK